MPPKTIAHFEVLDELGQGGMGVVYRARDMRLDREVAIKALPEKFGDEPERLARFEREARVLASFSHPHIGSIHGMEKSGGRSYLVLELVEGATLAERIAEGPIPIGRALELGLQITQALEAAHEHGIVHRDLKPANVKLTSAGEVKVLDFGLAKAAAPEVEGIDFTQSPTRTAEMTREGALLGTPAYMSPEQARGQKAGKQADIWAFGVVMWEMLTGRRPFEGKTTSDFLAAVLEKEPAWAELPTDLPPAGRRLLHRCLAKEPGQRLHHAADARLEVEAAQRELGEVPEGQPRRIPFASVGVLAALVGCLIAGGILGRWVGGRPASPSRPLTLHVDLPQDQRVVDDAPGTMAVAIDPAGRVIVYAGLDREGTTRLYRRALDHDEITALSGTEGATSAFFSPDGEWVAFLWGSELRKVPTGGGSVLPICPIPSGELYGGTWLVDGTIVFNADRSGGLLAVDSEGGVPRVLTKPEQPRELGHWHPSSVPGHPAVLFTVSQRDNSIAVFDLERNRRVDVIEGSNASYFSPGRLVFRRGGSLMVAPFDLGTLQTTGPPVPIADPIGYRGSFAVSHEGVLVSAVASGNFDGDERLVLADRDGSMTSVTDETRRYNNPVLSPDGRFVAFDSKGADIWVHDLGRGVARRLVVAEGTTVPVWAPDGQAVAFHQTSDAGRFIAVQRLGETASEILFESAVGNPFPTSWSRDGRYLVFYLQHPESGRDLWVLPLSGDQPAFPYLATPHNERTGVLAPDARWLAYVSNRSGTDEVYLSPFPEHGGRSWQVSADGGLEPRWSGDGGELTFRHGEYLMAVRVDVDEGEPALGPPERLFPLPYPSARHTPGYDRTEDDRFLMTERSDSGIDRLVISFDWWPGGISDDSR